MGVGGWIAGNLLFTESNDTHDLLPIYWFSGSVRFHTILDGVSPNQCAGWWWESLGVTRIDDE